MSPKRPTRKRLKSFAPVDPPDARVLILGTMPGVESLRQQQYYGHPQNAFWHIAGDLFGAGRDLPYTKRLDRLRKSKVALWDVIARCHREGSMDQDIEEDTLEPNNFQGLFKRCPRIRAVFFNGTNAARLYRRFVLPGLPQRYAQLHMETLPSSSPANARLTRGQKRAKWRRVLSWL
jgi:hypoxanthine-DNA glycosylase